MSNPNQRRVIIGIVAAGALGLVVVAVIAGLVVGLIARSVSSPGGGGESDISFRTERPVSIEELQDLYRFDSGSLEINLTGLELPDGTTEVEARGDTGALTIVVPKGVAVRAEAKVDNGVVSFFERAATGEDIEQGFTEEGYGQAGRRLSLDLSMGTGVISVVREE